MSTIARFLLGITAAALVFTGGQRVPKGPNFWAVVIGISKFTGLPGDEQLHFADADAKSFAEFIQTPRGRAFPKENVTVLLNQDATYVPMTRILAYDLKKKVQRDDIVYIFIATHGIVEKDQPRKTYLLAADSSTEMPYGTALPVDDLGALVTQRVGQAQRVVVFVDACRSGKLGRAERGRAPRHGAGA